MWARADTEKHENKAQEIESAVTGSFSRLLNPGALYVISITVSSKQVDTEHAQFLLTDFCDSLIIQ